MCLVHMETRQLEEFFNDIPPYAILPHTWGKEEITFQYLKVPNHQTKRGYAKIEGCCREAEKDKLSWAWIETCYIDKSGSAEISGAISPIFRLV
ncbi:HET domain-containing protein [Stagonosporopsis vannaccii]|nr:HET domain-containing protein [Stagonosporopsis vannaccii]